MLKTASDIMAYLQNDEFIMKTLHTAESLELPQWFIGAGFIRNTVWNVQHGLVVDYKFKDIDLGYYDEDHKSEEDDETLSAKLREKLDLNWEIVNQAYAHIYNDAAPYTSAIDGLSRWIETATCVGATLDENDKVVLLAPWGADDLLELRLRISPHHRGKPYYEDLFQQRIIDKKWLERWPKLTLV